MRFRKFATASAALGLVATPVLAQASDAPAARSGAAVGESEELAGASNAVIAALAVVVFTAGMVIAIEGDDDEDMPVSP